MEPRPPCPSAQSAPRVRVAAMTTWKQASGNPFGPPDDDGYGGLGAAFGAVDPAPAPVDARFTHPAPALAPEARKPAAPSAVPDAFATAPSYDQMFGGAEASAPTPPEPAAVPQPAPVMPPPMSPAAPAPPMPPAPPPAPATPPAPAFAAATVFPFGAAAESDDAFASTGGDPVKAASTDLVAPPKGSPPRTSVFTADVLPDVLPRSPRSPRASVFVPAPSGSFSQENPENPENETRAPFDDVAAHELLSFRSGPVSERGSGRGPDAVDAVDGVAGASRETTSFEVVAERDPRTTEEKEEDFQASLSDLSPFLRRRDEPEHIANTNTSLLTRDECLADDRKRETLRVAAETRAGDESVEALASAAATAASSARRLEARVQELDAELEAYRLGAGDAARALAEKEATVEALRADLAARERTEKEAAAAAAAAAKEEAERDAARLRTRLAEVSEKNTFESTSVVEAAHARRLEDRLEKATRALDRERAASAKAEALAAAATRRAAEAESAARATLERAETFERERDRLIATNGDETSRDTNPSSRKRDENVTVELRVAPDADALLAREAAAARLREEAEAISAASARVVEKLVRENGALVERIERFQAERAPAPRGRREGAGEEEEEEEAGFAATGFAYDSKERNEKNAREPAASAAISVAAPEEEAPNREAPRGLWAFITGADRAPAKYVPKRPNAPVAGGG